MNKPKPIQLGLMAAVAAAVTILVVWVGWDPAQTATGRALACCEGEMGLGVTGISKGDDVYWLAPAPSNVGDHEISLISVTPDVTSAGVEFVDVRIYKRSDFPSSAVPVGYGGKYRQESNNPARVKSVAVGGQRLAAGQTMDDVMLLHLRVATDQLPLNATGIKVVYEEKGEQRSQVLPAKLELYK